MNEFLISIIVILAVWIVGSGVIILGIAWTHYPYRRKRGKRR